MTIYSNDTTFAQLSFDFDSEVTPARKTYPQDWTNYNAAQIEEKDRFVELLTGLCSTIPQPEYVFGRPSLPLADMVFAICYKVYVGFSARRFSSDVRDAHAKGFIDNAPHFNVVNRYLANPDLTPIITNLVELSATPLSMVESHFSPDSSGFSTCRFDRWFDEKWGKQKSKRKWMKAHIFTGVKTNIVTSVQITPGSTNDSPMLEPLLESTAERFDVKEVSADKAYLSDANLKRIVEHGAYPYIQFKSNTTGKGSPLWQRLYAHFILNQEDFEKHYHLRSNVESTFNMVKSKFGDSVRSKSETGQVNEILLKILAHNIVVLIHEMHELGIEPSFEPKVASESKVIYLNQKWHGN